MVDDFGSDKEKSNENRFFVRFGCINYKGKSTKSSGGFGFAICGRSKNAPNRKIQANYQEYLTCEFELGFATLMAEIKLLGMRGFG